MSSRPSISAVVPTLGRPELLGRCLDALLGQDLRPDEFEVIVVDDGPSAATRALVEGRRRADGPALRYIANERGRGPAAARNLGWHAARAPLIAFTDDDCMPRPSWLRMGRAAFSDGIAGISGRLVMPLPVAPTDYELNAAGLEAGEFVTANAFYRREALAKAGGFDERFTSAWREDSDVFFSLVERGARLEHEPRAVVVHPVRPASWGVSLKQQKKTRFNALLFKKHPTLYRERLQRSPRLYYPMTLLFSGGLLLLFTGRRREAEGAGALWLALTFRLAGQRLRRTSKAPGHMVEMVVTSALIPPLALFWRLFGALRYRTPFF
jgi:glycosyltransferase involved in cell wall biosynthesis